MALLYSCLEVRIFEAAKICVVEVLGLEVRCNFRTSGRPTFPVEHLPEDPRVSIIGRIIAILRSVLTTPILSAQSRIISGSCVS